VEAAYVLNVPFVLGLEGFFELSLDSNISVTKMNIDWIGVLMVVVGGG
jgi:hypothetical protein